MSWDEPELERMASVVKWLEGPEGRLWSYEHHRQSGNQKRMFMLKDDQREYEMFFGPDGRWFRANGPGNREILNVFSSWGKFDVDHNRWRKPIRKVKCE
jgi:hypothetical protein